MLSFFLYAPGFCGQAGLDAELQKQARAYRSEGWESQQQGNLDEALINYQKALLLDHSYVVAYNDAGIVFEAKGLPEKAKEMYLKAIEIAPNYANSYSNLALLYEDQKDYSNAVLFWIKRASLGGRSDPWAEAARKRLEDIARILPEAFRDIGEQYKENLQQEKQLMLKQGEERRLIETKIQDSDRMAQEKRQQAVEQAERRKNELYFQKSQKKDRRLKDEEQRVSKRRAKQGLKKEKEEEELMSLQYTEPPDMNPAGGDTGLGQQNVDNKALALEHLGRAKDSFAQGEYVTALREATVAEYLDSSNKEISAFLDKVRRSLLE